MQTNNVFQCFLSNRRTLSQEIIKKKYEIYLELVLWSLCLHMHVNQDHVYEKTMQIWKRSCGSKSQFENEQNFIIALKNTYLESDI